MREPMIDMLLPRQLDNAYRGHPLALWLFGIVVLLKVGIGFGTMLNGRDAAVNADGFALDSFGPVGADAFVAMFSAWGLAQVVIGSLCILALIRYRALVPFLFVLLLVEHLGRKFIFYVLPIARIGAESAPGFYINVAIVALMVVGLVLSLRRSANPQAQ